MSIRLMASPPVLVGSTWRSTAQQYCTGGYVNIFPSKTDGTPASTWVLTFGRAASWTAADADSNVTLVFQSALDIVADVKTQLRTLTLGDLAPAERTRLQGVYDGLGVPSSDFTLATTCWLIVRRMIGWLFAKDDGLGGGLEF